MKKQFKDFGLSQNILESINACGFTNPTPIQEAAIPVILEGKDVVAQAQTGTGKTAAFALPALELIAGQKEGLLVIVPTRELAIQVAGEIAKYGKGLSIRTVAIYGGDSREKQISLIRKGVDVVVATPGRLLDLLEAKQMRFTPSIIVLDEADEMLNMGFLEDVQAIFSFLPKERQTLLFSATLADPIQKLIRKWLHDPLFIKMENSHQDIEHIFYDLKHHVRENAFKRVLMANNPAKAIIFCRTKKDVDDLSGWLMKEGLSAKGLHGDIQQGTRERITQAFRKGEIRFLVATDVAARGLDISDVSHVFNYQIPVGPEEYVHRTGRTGRAGRKGIAITLGTQNELRKLQRMLNGLDDVLILPIPTAEHMYERQMDQMVDRIAKQPLQGNVNELMDRLMEKVSFDDLSTLLLSYVIEREGIVKKEEEVFVKPRASAGREERRRGERGGFRRQGRSGGGQRSGHHRGARARHR